MRVLVAIIVCQLVAIPALAQPPVHSFEDLQKQLTIGQKIVVVDASGQRRRGAITSITGDHVAIEWWNVIFQHREQLFVADTVRKVDSVDSTWNGGLIGFGVGCLFVWWAAAAGSPLYGAFVSAFALPLGIGIGQQIDLAYNRTIFESAHQPNAVTLFPIVGPHEAGISARLRF